MAHVAPTSDSPGADRNPKTRQRAALACTRCRRYRTRCIALPPYTASCQNCQRARAECHFPARGEVDVDRYHRRRPANTARSPADTIIQCSGATTSVFQSPEGASDALPSGGNQQAAKLPPYDVIAEALECLSKSYFQITFLPHTLMLEQAENHPETLNTFLICSILTLSAGWTPSIHTHFPTPERATEHYYRLAEAMIGTQLLKPSIESCQAFFLLALHNWGRGNSEASTMLLGTAVRMCGLLSLHREVTYTLPENASTKEIITSEVARRTFWAIVTHEDLASGFNRLANIRLDEIDALLPGEDSDFNFGINPGCRPTLHGTLPHIAHPESANTTPKSLFASMVQSHALWAAAARWACHPSEDPPWHPSSTYQSLQSGLMSWEKALPPIHKWSQSNLRGMRAEGRDIPYLSHTACYKLAGIVMRRKYLPAMANAIASEVVADAAPPGYWPLLAHEMVTASFELILIMVDFFKLRPPSMGFAPILIFALYLTGNIALYVAHWPMLCPALASQANTHVQQCLRMLSQLGAVWPMADSWYDAFCTCAATLPSSISGCINLRDLATAERSADETIGIYRHARSNSQQQRLPFDSAPTQEAAQSAVCQVPASLPVHAVEQLPFVQTGPDGATSDGVDVGGSPQPHYATDVLAGAAQPYLTHEAPLLFPLTHDGLPYDALEDHLVAFFRGDVPSYWTT